MIDKGLVDRRAPASLTSSGDSPSVSTKKGEGCGSYPDISPQTLPAIPDVSTLEPEKLSPEDNIEIVMALREQRKALMLAVMERLAPIDAVIARAEAQIKGAIVDAGGTMLPHDRFDVVVEQPTKRDKRLDILISELKGKLPADLYREAIYPKSIDGTLAPELLVAAEQFGASVHFDADLRKLDMYARKFGGEIADIVAKGSPRVDVGAPVLKITPRESALKAVAS